jgi:uncharacterized alkaline shock family protein YloU
MYIYLAEDCMEKSHKTPGSLKISEEVLIKTAVYAVAEVEGVALDDGGRRLAREEIHGVKDNLSRPVKVKLASEAAEIDVCVVLKQGFKAVHVAEQIQRAVKSAVQNMAGIAVSKVNVSVVGVRLTEDGK